MLIPLTRDKVAIVDSCDYLELIKYKWSASKLGNVFYAVRNGEGPNVLMHREILEAPEGSMIDHINHNGLDNRRCNLRLCTRSQNGMNRCKNANNRFKGVSWHKDIKKWRAQITVKGRRISLGYFFCIVKAAKAYDKAALRYYGVFANINFK